MLIHKMRPLFEIGRSTKVNGLYETGKSKKYSKVDELMRRWVVQTPKMGVNGLFHGWLARKPHKTFVRGKTKTRARVNATRLEYTYET